MKLQSITRRQTLGLMAASGAALVLPSCTGPAPISVRASIPAPQLLDDIAWRLLERQPEHATSLGIDIGKHAPLRFALEDRSPEGVDQLAAIVSEDLGRVEYIATARLDPAVRTSVEVVKSAYRLARDGFALPYGDVAVGGWRNTPYVVIQNVGAYLDVPRFLDADHPIREEQDAEAFLSRLSQWQDQLDGETERIAMAEAAGLVPPDFLLDKTIGQLRQTIADARGDGALVDSLVRRTQSIPGDWHARARQIIRTSSGPALERQLAAIIGLRAQAGPAPGMRERPQGEQFYSWALRASTTTQLSPDEIHELGLEELESLHARMEPILRELDYREGTIGERMAALAEDPRFQFAPGDAGRAEIMQSIQRRIDWIKDQMPLAFRKLAPGNVEVRRLPIAEEPGAPAAYGGPGSIDGSIPGKMWINLGSTDLHRQYDLPTLVHHEAIPGHVWQGEYANRLPLIRSLLAFNAFSEGWALYGEQLADELGAYGDDPVGRLGYLQSLAFRACRMVVDTGLHARGWSRERAVDFFMTRNGNKRAEVESEVDRYCSWPGQACGYKMGHSEILRQRERAASTLEDSFDIRDFNQAIVDGGNVPLDVLAGNVDRYMAVAAS